MPVVPITINGSFDVKPRTNDLGFVHFHALRMTIHKPIPPQSKGAENVKQTMDESYEAIMSSLVPEYQGYEKNPDQ
jgi:1-acyl-sn-glycerol-3-phosphate acyltransferase